MILLGGINKSDDMFSAKIIKFVHTFYLNQIKQPILLGNKNENLMIWSVQSWIFIAISWDFLFSPFIAARVVGHQSVDANW